MDRPRPTNSSTWLPVSATECTDSASIDADPVSRNATNLITAMPRLAANAASTARISRQETRTWLLDPGLKVLDRHALTRVDPGRDGQVDARVVGQLDDAGQPHQRVL